MSNEEKVDMGEQKSKQKNNLKIVGIICGIIILVFGAYLNYLTKNSLYNGKISNNVFIEDVDISNLTKEEAINVINKKYKPQDLNLEFDEVDFVIKSDDIDLSYNTEQLVNEAYNNTRTGSYIKDIQNYFTTCSKGKEYTIKVSFDEEKLNNNISEIGKKINREAQSAKVSIGSGINITPSQTGLEFLTEENEKHILKALNEKSNKSVQLKVNVIQPRIKTEDVQSINTNLASFTTSFNSGQVARSYNIGLAASKCNGTILLPGETFSYNEHTGRRIEANGYKPAPVILNGEIIDEPGGGVCQTSTTLFNAALLSGLDITEVRNHSITSKYVPRGRDAMVADGSSDLKFTNNFDHAVYVSCYRSGGTVSAAIYGSSSDRVGVSVRVDQFTYNGKPAAKTYRTITKDGKSKESYIYTSIYKK